jgi:hypothetical protein
VTEDTRAWTCACGARGTFAFPSELGDSKDDPPFYCPRCRTKLSDCRRTRRASRSQKPRIPLPGDETLEDLTEEDVERSAREWERTQEHVGKLGAMAESMWALDWADRLLAALRRRQDG